MKSLSAVANLLLFPLALIGAAAFLSCATLRTDPYAKAGSERYLFVRNLTQDTLFGAMTSPDVAVTRHFAVPPADSSCIRVPFPGAAGMAVFRLVDDYRVFPVDARQPGVTWVLVGENQTPPDVTVCSTLLPPK